MRTRNLFVALAWLIAATGLALAAAQWQADPAQSTLKFVGTQAGAAFTGVFDKFAAAIQFDPNNLAAARFIVTIDMTSVGTKDKERDTIIRGPDIFAVEKFPTARYVASKFTSQGDGKYLATGQLTLRDVTRDTPIEFTFTSDGSGAWLKGTAKLKRLDFGVGQGEWRDTEWVGNDVRVEFSLRLQQR